MELAIEKQCEAVVSSSVAGRATGQVGDVVRVIRRMLSHYCPNKKARGDAKLPLNTGIMSSHTESE